MPVPHGHPQSFGHAMNSKETCPVITLSSMATDPTFRSLPWCSLWNRASVSRQHLLTALTGSGEGEGPTVSSRTRMPPWLIPEKHCTNHPALSSTPEGRQSHLCHSPLTWITV